MSPKIHTPVKGFTGNVVGVDFKNGEGETNDPAALEYFERQGYEIEADEKPKEPSERDLLIAEAKTLGLDTKGKNAEIKKRIADHKANAGKQEPQTPPASEDKGTGDGADGSKPADSGKDEEKSK